MSPRLGLLCVLLLWSVPARGAQPALPPEQLLAEESLLYLRFDGSEAHRQSLARTAAGEVFRGDLGNFVAYLASITRDVIGPAVLKDHVLGGSVSERLPHIRRGFSLAPQALEYLGRHGVVVGAELTQLTVVFPGAGEPRHRDAVVAGLRLIAALAEVDIVESKVEGRSVFQWDPKTTGNLIVAWWQEASHVVFILGTQKPEHKLELIQKKRASLEANPHYKSLHEFKRYETLLRGFVDVERVLQPLQLWVPPAGKIAEALGLANLKSVSLHFGCEGRHLRSTLALHVPGPRKGLLNLSTASKPFDLNKLPPLPPDLSALYALQLDLGAVYDLVLEAARSAAGIDTKEGLKQLETQLGFDLRKDLLASLGSRVVLYNTPSEGPMSLGFGTVLEVKDPRKLQATLDALFQALPALLGEDIHIKKQTYCGTEMYVARYAQQGFFFAPSYAIHKDQLVFGMFPQTVQGYLLRATGKCSVWKPTPLVVESLASATKDGARVAALNVSDPRPTIQQLCAIGPFIAGLADSFSPGSFDVNAVPNAQAVNEPLYPNVSVLIDDGTTIRLETHASLALPLFDVTGTDAIFTTQIAFQLFRLGF